MTDLATKVTEDSPLLTGIVNIERRINAGSGGGVLNVKWRWCVLCAAMGIVGLVRGFCSCLAPRLTGASATDGGRHVCTGGDLH